MRRVGYALSYALYYALDDGARLTALSVSGPRKRLLTLSGVQIVVSVDQFSILKSRWSDDVTLYFLPHFSTGQVLLSRKCLCGNQVHAAKFLSALKIVIASSH